MARKDLNPYSSKDKEEIKKNPGQRLQRDATDRPDAKRREDDSQRSCNYEEKNSSQWGQNSAKNARSGCGCEGAKKELKNSLSDNRNANREDERNKGFGMRKGNDPTQMTYAPKPGNGDDDDDEESEPEEDDPEENASNLRGNIRNQNDLNRRNEKH